MIRMSRAGRKSLMLGALQKWDRRYPKGSLPTAKLAHAAGLMSSTEVVKMLREMAHEGLITEVEIEPSYQCGYMIRAWKLARYEQMPLPDHWIKINGDWIDMGTGEAVGYVNV